SSRSAASPVIGGYSQVRPRPCRSGAMSPNGSIATVTSPARRAKADWPNHSTCMLLLCSESDERLAVTVLAAPQQRGGGRHQAGEDRERERGVQAVLERPGDQVREEAAADQR